MASESTENRTVSVTIPAELDDWLDEQATQLGIARNQLLVQLVASYQTAAKHDGEFSDCLSVVDKADISAVVDEQLDTVLEEQLDETISEQVSNQINVELGEELEDQIQSQAQEIVERVVGDRINEATNSVQRQLSNRIESVDSDFQSKIQDVRDRVIQVKKETDTKAPRDHDHPEFDQLPTIVEQVETLQENLSLMQDEYEETVPEHAEKIVEFDERLAQIEDRLQTVAWVVSDLRDAHESSGLEAVDRIKRAAAKADIERANCEKCGEGVAISLMTDPKCPHCDATVSNIEPAGGWFGNPKLLAASQLESGEQ